MVSKYTGLNGGTKTSKTARSDLDLEQTQQDCIEDADSSQQKNDHWVKDFFSSKLESVVRIAKRLQNLCCGKRGNVAVSQHANTFESSQKRSIIYFIASLIAYLSLAVFIHLYSSVDQKFMCALADLQFMSRAFGYGIALFIVVFSPFIIALIDARGFILTMCSFMTNFLFVVVLIKFCLLDNSNQTTVQNISNYTCIGGVLRKKVGAVSLKVNFTKSQIELLVNTRLKHSPLFNTRNSSALCKAWDTVCNELNFDQSKANIRRKFSNLLDSYKKAKRDNRQFEWAYLFDDTNEQIKLLEESENDSYKKMKRSKKVKQYDEKESEENKRDEIENRESEERNETEIENRESDVRNESEDNKKDTKSVDYDRDTEITDESKTKTKKRDKNKNNTNSSFSQRPSEKEDSESQQFFTQPVNVYEKAMNDTESVETDKSYTSNIDNYNGLVPRVNIDSMSNYDEKYNEILSSDDGKEEEKSVEEKGKDKNESESKKNVVKPKEMSKQDTSEVNLDGLSNEERIKFMDFYNKMKKKEKSKEKKIDDYNAEKKKKKAKESKIIDSMKKENILERKDAQNNHSKYKDFGKTNKQETKEMQKDVNKIVEPVIESKKLSDEKVMMKKEKRKEQSNSKQSLNESKIFKTNSTVKKDNDKKSVGKKSVGKESTGNMSIGKASNGKKSDITYFENEKADNLLASINKLNENITLLIEIFKNKK